MDIVFQMWAQICYAPEPWSIPRVRCCHHHLCISPCFIHSHTRSQPAPFQGQPLEVMLIFGSSAFHCSSPWVDVKGILDFGEPLERSCPNSPLQPSLNLSGTSIPSSAGSQERHVVHILQTPLVLICPLAHSSLSLNFSSHSVAPSQPSPRCSKLYQ